MRDRLIPYRRRTAAHTIDGHQWGWNILYTVAILIVLSIKSAFRSYGLLSVGWPGGMLIRFMLGTKNNGAWGDRSWCRRSVIGLDMTSLSRRHATYPDSRLPRPFDDDLTENSRMYDAIDDWTGHQYGIRSR